MRRLSNWKRKRYQRLKVIKKEEAGVEVDQQTLKV
jgi:hypothetical protein